MPTEYKCCLCQVVSGNCTRKCFICASGEKRICNTCLARHNKCSECRGETTAAVDVLDSSKKSAPKRKKSVEQGTISASAINTVATTAQHESSTSSSAVVVQAVVVTSPTTAAKNAASALSEIKKKQGEAAAFALGQERERTKAASVAATLQQEVDRDRTIAQIAAQRQQERQQEAVDQGLGVPATALPPPSPNSASAIQLYRERRAAAAEVIAAQQQQERDQAAAIAAQQQQERDQAAAIAAQQELQRRERDQAAAEAAAAAAAIVAQQQRDREQAATIAAQQQRERDKAAADSLLAHQQRGREQAAIIAALQKRELEQAAAITAMLQLQREREQAAAAEVQQQRERDQVAAIAAQQQREREQAAAIAAQQQRDRDQAAAAIAAQQQQRDQDQAAADAVQQQRDRDQAAADAAQQQQREREQAAVDAAQQADAATSMVIAASDISVSTEEVDDITVGTIINVDPRTYSNISNWPVPPSFQPLETYQGVHPWKRKHSQPHQHYPLCRIYEHLTDTGVAVLRWQISSSSILEELSTTNAFQRLLIEATPPLLWLRNSRDLTDEKTATAFRSPSNSIFGSSITAVPTITTIHNSSSIVTNVEVAPAVAVSSSIAENNNAAVIDLSVDDHTLTSTNVPSAAVASNPSVVDSSAEDNKEGSVVEVHSTFPNSRKDYEKTMHQYLRALYTEPFKFPFREVSIGGRKYELDCFHYVDSLNSSQPEFKNKRGRKYEFVNRKGENATIYRWEIKMAVITSLLMREKKMED